jgi:hypothetical protein
MSGMDSRPQVPVELLWTRFSQQHEMADSGQVQAEGQSRNEAMQQILQERKVMARKPVEERRSVSPLKRFLMECPFEFVVRFVHETSASWGITRPSKLNSRRQSAAYRARIQIPGHLEHMASGDTAHAALCNALASFLTYEQDDFHTLREP